MITHDKTMRYLRTLTMEEAIKDYIHHLENQSPVVSTSHCRYYAYAQRFGSDVWENALDEYFKTLKKEG